VPGLGDATRARIDELTDTARRFGARGLVTLGVTGDRVHGPSVKFLGDERAAELARRCGAADGDLVLIVADRPHPVADILGRLRAELGSRLGLADPTVLAYCWSTGSPCTSGTRSATAGTRPTTRSRAWSPRMSRSS